MTALHTDRFLIKTPSKCHVQSKKPEKFNSAGKVQLNKLHLMFSTALPHFVAFSLFLKPISFDRFRKRTRQNIADVLSGA